MDICGAINGSKLAWGAAALCVNLGARYLMQDVTPLQERIMTHFVFKRLVLFCIVFLTTRDLLMSAAITALFWILVDHLLNDSSRFCIAPGICRGRGSGGSPTMLAQPVVTRQMYMNAMRTVAMFQRQQQHHAGQV
jgi:hypothetical protein